MSARVLIEEIVRSVREAVGSGHSQPVPLHAPDVSRVEREWMSACLTSTQVSTAGSYVQDFEEALRRVSNAKHVIATVNGTAGLQVSLLALGVRPGDEVLLPSLTFVATANAVLYCGAIPHLLDCDVETLGLDVAKLEEYLESVLVERGGQCVNRNTGRRIAAVIPVHTFGHPMDFDGLRRALAGFRIPVLEDAANALGSQYKGRTAGLLGEVGIYSFNGNKIITTGGGGAIVTDDDELAGRMRHLVGIARADRDFRIAHDELGFNYRMPSLNAAFGCAQVSRLDSFLKRKRVLARRYCAAFAEVEDVEVFQEPEYARSNYWLNTIILPSGGDDLLKGVIEGLEKAGLCARPSWIPLHWLPYLSDYPKMNLEGTDRLASSLLNLPSSPALVVE